MSKVLGFIHSSITLISVIIASEFTALALSFSVWKEELEFIPVLPVYVP